MLPPLPLLEHNTQALNYTKNISEVAKQYENDYKYDGLGSLNIKLDIFFNIYKYNNIPTKLYIRAFPIILKGLALD
jgi:hypothetical protein